MEEMDDSLGTLVPQVDANNEMDIQDEMPVPKEEIVDIKADDSDLDIIEVHCNINPNPTAKKHMQNIMRKKMMMKRANRMSNKQPSLNVKEEIVISDSSDEEHDLPATKQPKPSYSTRRSKEDSLSSIILNCPKCNKTKTVFSTTLTTECKECKVNMNFVCNECNLTYESLIALFRHKKIQCKKYLSPIVQFVHKCIKCQVKYKICNFTKARSCLKCKRPMAYECTICGKEQISHGVIYRHVRNMCQSASRAYFCNDCQYKGQSQRALLLHLSSCHQNLYQLSEKCDKCGKSFANHLSLEQHKSLCGMPYYYCKICPYRPRLRQSLKRHLMIAHTVSKDEVDKMVEDCVCPQVYPQDLLEDKIEVDQKPALITQGCPTQSGPKTVEKPTKKRKHKKKFRFTHKKRRLKTPSSKPTPSPNQSKQSNNNTKIVADCANTSDSSGDKQTGLSESIVSNNNNNSNIQIASVVSKAECFSHFENNNDLESTPSEEELELSDPLHIEYTLEENETVREEIIIHVAETTPTSIQRNNFNLSSINIKLFTPYIRKLCGRCEQVAELTNDSKANQTCNSCGNPVTYCCKLCLEISNLNSLYLHIFTFHNKEVTRKNVLVKSNPNIRLLCGKCSSHFVCPIKLKEHELGCNVLPNLFCPYCPSKMRLKREMREHMVNEHSRQFEKDELEKILDEIVDEGDSVMNILTLHNGYCGTCKKQISLRQQRPIYCVICSTKLIYHCNDHECSSLVFKELTRLQMHLRHHAINGWKKKYNNKVRVCHLCSYKDEPLKVQVHMRQKHPDIFRCKCDSCGAILKNVQAWKRHQAHYCPATRQKLQCGHCWFMCFRKRRMRSHLQNVHTHLYTGERPRCNKCGIAWAGFYRLRWHESRCGGDFELERAKQKELRAMRGIVTLT